MRTVFLISPYAETLVWSPPYPSTREEAWALRPNVQFARACIADCLRRGEAPFAPHLLYTQPGILNDDVPEERERGMKAGEAFLHLCDYAVMYIDRGISTGMKREAMAAGSRILIRRLDKQPIDRIGVGVALKLNDATTIFERLASFIFDE